VKKEDIIKLPNSHLRQRSKRISVVNNKTRKLASDMKAAAVDWEKSRQHEISAALSAVQVDRLERVVIIRDNLEDKDVHDFNVLVNPEIIKYEGKIIEDFEGCLSVNGFYGKVPRYTKVRVKALDLDGNEIRLKAEGFLARVLQHEVDHTKGMLFIDHIKDKEDAFYALNKKGELEPLDYDKKIKDNRILWQ
jgi:peptide deformylase